MYNDKTIVCKDCGHEFTFTANEQEIFAEKGFTNEPQRCKDCRIAAKAKRAPRSDGSRDGKFRFGAQHQMYDAVCAECGKACQVPFQPSTDRPAMCSYCFQYNR